MKSNGEIEISYEAYLKLFTYASIANKEFSSEIGGHLIIEEIEGGGLRITDVILPEQTVSGGSFKAQPHGKWLKELSPEQISKIRGWWHSHNTMGVFHSGTDDDTLEDKWNGETTNSPNYAISLVVSLPNKMIAYMKYFKPVETEKFEVPIAIMHPVPEGLTEKCNEEVKEKVKKETFFRGWDFYEGIDGYGYGYFKSLRPEVKPELPDKKDGEKTEKTEEEDEEEEIEIIEDNIIDAVSGLSIADMKAAGVWNPDAYPHLAEELEAEIKAMCGRRSSMKNAEKVPGGCGNLVKNHKGDVICFFFGKNARCDKCPKNPLKPKETKSETEPVKPLQTFDVDTPMS